MVLQDCHDVVHEGVVSWQFSLHRAPDFLFLHHMASPAIRRDITHRLIDSKRQTLIVVQVDEQGFFPAD